METWKKIYYEVILILFILCFIKIMWYDEPFGKVIIKEGDLDVLEVNKSGTTLFYGGDILYSLRDRNGVITLEKEKCKGGVCLKSWMDGGTIITIIDSSNRNYFPDNSQEPINSSE